MEVFKEEIFGPVLAIAQFATEEEALTGGSKKVLIQNYVVHFEYDFTFNAKRQSA